LSGKVWIERNLGASRVARASNDEQAYGDLYQWGRLADGHQCRNSANTTTLSSSNVPGHNKFIVAPSYLWDWRSPQNHILWQRVNGINNPCPTGYRLPTNAELDANGKAGARTMLPAHLLPRCACLLSAAASAAVARLAKLAHSATIGHLRWMAQTPDSSTSSAAMPRCSATIVRTGSRFAASRISPQCGPFD
jgi:hypothetical protein